MPLAAAVAALALTLPPFGQDAAKSHPPQPKSLLIVTFDTTRRDYMGFLGKSPSPTPNLDRLAGTSCVFTDAYTVAPITLPAHSSLMTGLYPQSHGVHENTAYKLPQDALTLAEILNGKGYATAATVGTKIMPALMKENEITVANEGDLMSFNTGDLDVSAQVTKMKSLNPDGVVVSADYSQAVTVIREMKRQGLIKPVVGATQWSAHASGLAIDVNPFCALATNRNDVVNRTIAVSSVA